MAHLNVNGLSVEVARKNIKNLHLAVYPPNGRVRVAVPLRVNDEAVRLAVISKLSWIKKQQAKFANQPRQSPREYVSGESHYFQGNRYRLRVIEHPGVPRIHFPNKTRLELWVKPNSTLAHREQVLWAWYRQHLKETLPTLIAKWEPMLGVHVADWGVRYMKTKWGTCNIQAQRIWLNLELAKKSPRCLEYVVVHEMVHLLERKHNERFMALMDQFLPSWRTLRDELNREPLAHEGWEY